MQRISPMLFCLQPSTFNIFNDFHKIHFRFTTLRSNVKQQKTG